MGVGGPGGEPGKGVQLQFLFTLALSPGSCGIRWVFPRSFSA